MVEPTGLWQICLALYSVTQYQHPHLVLLGTLRGAHTRKSSANFIAKGALVTSN